MVFSLLPVAGLAAQNDTSEQATSDEFMKIVFLDCGRKYFSVDSIKKIIDNAAAAGFNYIQLAVGNDGLRFLLDDMSLTVNGTTYTSEQVSAAIHSGNEAYYNFTTDELTQSEMNTIISYAKERGLAVIPCVNTPGHMDAILSAANRLTGTTCSYNGSARTIDVTNTTAVAFTQALLQKYITYFAGKGCEFFNMGADEYANDKYTSGSMGFGNLQSTDKYRYYVQYVNQVAGLIKGAQMTPMAFNDGIYFNSNTSSGTFDTDIVICYWSNGWSGYTPMPAADLAAKGFKMVNTNGSYYWVLGKPDAQCSPSKASGFTTTAFPGGTVSDPAGAMFCIWCDYPNAETEASVISKTADTIAAFGNTLPKTDPLFPVEPTISSDIDLGSVVTGAEFTLSLPEGTTAEWDSSDPGVIYIYATRGTVSANSVTVKALKAGSATITATLENDTKVTKDITVTDLLTKEFTIAVGETKTDTQSGNYPGPYSGYDSSIATVAGEAKEIAGSTGDPIKQTTLTSGSKYIIGDGNGNYLKRSETTLTNVTSPDDATEWTVTSNSDNTAWNISDNLYYLRYYQKPEYSYNGSWILNVSTDTSSYISWGYDSDGGFRYYDFSSYSSRYYLRCSGTTWQVGTTNSNNGAAYVKGTLTPGGYETTISFRGVAVGTTTVDIGGVHYIINVVPEDLNNVTPLTIEYWITNARLTGSDGSQKLTINATDNGVATEAGIVVTDRVALTGNKDGRTQEYWQAKILDVTKTNSSTSGTELQTGKQGDDETLNGNAFTKVRYYNGVWQVYTSSWVTVDRTQTSFTYTGDNSTTVTYSGDTNQLVAYYMEVVDIKNSNDNSELHVNAADWGTKGDGTGSWGYTPENDRCSVSIQIVYEDSTTNPSDTTASSLKSKTIVYGYWTGGRGLGTMIFTGQGSYQIYKVSAETGTMTSSVGSGNTVTVTNFDWDKNAETVWEGDPTDSVSIGNPARSPSYEAPYDNLAWNTGDYNKNNAILIRVYVKAVANEDSLHVNYYDEQDTSTPFYDYSITVPKTTVFDSGFALTANGLVNNTVMNSNGQLQTVQSNLSQMPQIGAQYRYSEYTCVRVERSEDGKTVNLYYTFKNTVSFVVDYGLPLTIKPEDVNPALTGKVTKTEVVKTHLKYGVVSVKGTAVVYQLNYPISSVESIQVTYTGVNPTTNETDTFTYNAYIYPATTVYYEDGANFIDYKGTTAAAWEIQTNATPSQHADKLGIGSPFTYGYDSVYDDCSTFSLNGYHKVTVDANSGSGLTNWPQASFTFKGTGFDVISLTDSTSGAIYVDVYEGAEATGNACRSFIVDNYYGYSGDTSIDTSKNPLYQVPVMKVSGLTYGEYTAVITVAYEPAFNQTGKNEYSFWLDAIRIYDPADGLDDTIYKQDSESYPAYAKIRSQLIAKDAFNVVGNEQLANGAVFVDSKGETGSVEDYTNYGPNNETYLKANQGVAFQLIANQEPTSTQIGIKMANGKTGLVNVYWGKDLKTLYSTIQKVGSGAVETHSTATDMYYRLLDITWIDQGNGTWISSPITIKNASNGTLAEADAIVSLTNIKITGNSPMGFVTDAQAVIDNTSGQAMVAFFSTKALVDFAHDALEADPVLPPSNGGSTGGGGGGGSTGGVISSDPTNVPGSDWKNPYDDVKDGSWYYDYVKTVTEAGLMNGQGSGFGPDGKLTRAMMVTILYRMSGSPEVTGENPFTDVPAGTWYSDAVLWAYDKGIVKGTSETTFAPTADITRQDMATIIARYAAAFQIELKAADGSTFSDDSAIAGYAKDAVYSMKASGILSGKGNDRFDPQGTTTRAETAKVIALLHAI